ncbi:hypothetical protein L6452_22366 [Arctium lappa]|uniref:Uncharacterized protein n=1 Tax=Arctium lappa TaxID=4217 RepID=A0ACB9AZM0_ARCLA|nr:hypothetical protein L6452_22366 [Arctium lappa]
MASYSVAELLCVDHHATVEGLVFVLHSPPLLAYCWSPLVACPWVERPVPASSGAPPLNAIDFLADSSRDLPPTPISGSSVSVGRVLDDWVCALEGLGVGAVQDPFTLGHEQ